MAKTKQSRFEDQAVGVRFARVLASPVGVLVTLPVLVVAVGIGITLVGRNATSTASMSMARRQLAEQATSVQSDVSFALDQAQPLLDRLAVLAEPDRPLDDTLVRLHDLIVGRPGVAFLSISFPDGTFRASELQADNTILVQESRLVDAKWFSVVGGALQPNKIVTTNYDPRQRPFYALAERAGTRVWTPPYTFFRSHDTGITCAAPLYDANHALRAVMTVDFNVGALSTFVARPALDQARSVVFTRDGTILAYPSAASLPPGGRSESAPLHLRPGDKLLRHEDLHDSALDTLLASPTTDHLRFAELSTPQGAYLASVAPIGGKRAGVAVPLDWFVATLVPASTLLGPTHELEKSSLIASGGAMAIAVGLALVLAWNLVRMRRQVAASREQARSAEQRALDLGSYRLVAKLGIGGMGEVWRAEHRLLARSAAIKLIRPEVLHDPEGIEEVRERFRREAQTLASMKCRHTIAIFDYGVTAEGVFYYVMELLDGLDLESLVARYGAQPAPRVIRLLVQACASLAEAHDAGLLHRDIKPPNLFACRAADEVDILKLLDFGIVQTFHEPQIASRMSSPPVEQSPPGSTFGANLDTPRLTQVGAMLGTPGFMAPEQILGMQLDGRADIYALGCVAWWLLTGREVFDREVGEAKLLHKHISEPVPALATQVRGWCPPELEAVIASCLAKEMEDRPADARALANKLRAIEIPVTHTWSESRATAWWNEYYAPEPISNMPSAEVQVIVADRTNTPTTLNGPDPTSAAAADPT